MIVILIVLFILVFPIFVQVISWLFLTAVVLSLAVAVLGVLRSPR